jgi:hypothetical protein
MGHDSNEKVYTYDSFNTLDEADHANGNVDGDTWTWQSETRWARRPPEDDSP